MNTKPKTLIILLLFNLVTVAQHRGNYNQITPEISRQNILSVGNAQIFNPAKPQNHFRPLSPSNVLTIDVKALHNETAATYTAIFNTTQIGETASITNKLMQTKVEAIKTRLQSAGIRPEDIAIDVISFIPVYEVEVTKKLFSKTYTEVPKGFELQQNIHIKFSKTSQFESILTACAESEVYNLVKVDYFIDDLRGIYKNLQNQLIEVIDEKKAYYTKLGFDLEAYDIAIADDKFCYFPKDFYRSYQAFNSVSFEALKKNSGVTKAQKQTSYYYQPLTYESYDLINNPSVLEPVVQVGMNIKIVLTPKPKDPIKNQEPVVKTEYKHKYYVISPDGAIDVKALKTED